MRTTMLLFVIAHFCGLIAHAQVPYDLSRAVKMQTVWRMSLGGECSGFSFNSDFCGRDALHVLTSGVTGRGRVTWSTFPALDTTNLFDWLGVNNPIHLRAFDYDGQPPLEYLNAKGIIWRCSQGASPFPLIPIDTAAFAVCTGPPELSIDLDNDGFLDVITDIGGGGYTARVVMGGPQAGNGCERVFNIPIINGRFTNSTLAFYRSVTGRWRLVQRERQDRESGEWLVLYDVTIERVDGKLSVRFAKIHERRQSTPDTETNAWGPVEVLVDTAAGRDWLLTSHIYTPNGGLTGPWVVERYDATEGTFAETGERVTGFEYYSYAQRHLGYSMGTTKPVIQIQSKNGPLLCYADDLTHPFARWIPTGTGVQPVAGQVMINDQTGDGLPDMVVVGGYPESVMLLLTLDSAITGVDATEAPEGTLRYSATTGMLTIVADTDAEAHIDIVDLRGRVVAPVGPYAVHPGETHVDLRARLSTLPSGMYLVRVAMGDMVKTVSILH